MIDVKELRVGNYIFQHENKIVRVEQISSKKIELHECERVPVLFTEDQRICYSDIINPIPITMEFFRLNGEHTEIVHNDKSRSLYFKFGSITLESYTDPDYREWLACRVRPDNPRDRNFISNIKYIHQLQNLYFAINQEELIIKFES